MAKFEGNIWSKAAGSIGSITFSQARARQGKIQTARDRVIPTNPQTPQQMSARDNLSDSVFIARAIANGPDSTAFDRAVSKLPAYQSLMSIYQKAKAVDGTDIVVDGEPARIPRSDLPEVFVSGFVHSGSGEYQISFSLSTGASITPNAMVVGAITRVMPRSDIQTFRFQRFTFSPVPSSPVFVDMGGFPNQTSGLLFHVYTRLVDGSGARFYSPINWHLGTG